MKNRIGSNPVSSAMLKHHKKLRELSINPKTGKIDMRKLKSNAFKEELVRIITNVKEKDLVNFSSLVETVIGKSSNR